MREFTTCVKPTRTFNTYTSEEKDDLMSLCYSFIIILIKDSKSLINFPIMYI